VFLRGGKRVGRNGGVEVGQQLGKRAEQGTKAQERLACKYQLSQGAYSQSCMNNYRELGGVLMHSTRFSRSATIKRSHQLCLLEQAAKQL